MNNSFFPALMAMLSVFFLSFAMIDMFLFVSKRYKDKYLEETSTELNDILLQLPPARVLDLNLAISVFCGIIGAVLYGLRVQSPKPFHLFMVFAVFFIISFPIPKLILRFMKKKRTEKFNIQLEGALGNVASSLKAGFSINQAFEELAASNKHPLSVEFRMLMQEIRLGVTMDDALENMTKRINSADFELVATAVITARQTGGELTGTLERLAALIRERMRINNKLKAMTSMGRLQALMIGCMPFLLLWGMYHVSPGMVNSFLNTPVGYIALLVVIILDVIGFLVIKKITTIDV
ncbi:MAG: type II secretion system F family protein [Lentisphaeria bacterium]|nr:type II secretion system F family protein [Lentisphaeria bacterium]